jgi:hypothetical protein
MIDFFRLNIVDYVACLFRVREVSVVEEKPGIGFMGV